MSNGNACLIVRYIKSRNRYFDTISRFKYMCQESTTLAFNQTADFSSDEKSQNAKHMQDSTTITDNLKYIFKKQFHFYGETARNNDRSVVKSHFTLFSRSILHNNDPETPKHSTCEPDLKVNKRRYPSAVVTNFTETHCCYFCQPSCFATIVSIQSPMTVLSTFAKLRKATISFLIYVCLSALNNSAPTGRIFTKFHI